MRSKDQNGMRREREKIRDERRTRIGREKCLIQSLHESSVLQFNSNIPESLQLSLIELVYEFPPERYNRLSN